MYPLNVLFEWFIVILLIIGWTAFHTSFVSSYGVHSLLKIKQLWTYWGHSFSSFKRIALLKLLTHKYLGGESNFNIAVCLFYLVYFWWWMVIFSSVHILLLACIKYKTFASAFRSTSSLTLVLQMKVEVLFFFFLIKILLRVINCFLTGTCILHNNGYI